VVGVRVSENHGVESVADVFPDARDGVEAGAGVDGDSPSVAIATPGVARVGRRAVAACAIGSPSVIWRSPGRRRGPESAR